MIQLNFTPFPVLTTDRLLLRQLTTNDADEIFLLRSDEKVNKYVDRPRAQSIDDAIAFIKKIDGYVANNQSCYWAISLKDDPKLIGTITLWNLSAEDEKGETGYELLPQHQGKGIMQEAFSAVINYAFDVMKLKTIEAWTHRDNIRSSKILEKNGFKRDHAAEEKNKEHPGELEIYILRNPESSDD